MNKLTEFETKHVIFGTVLDGMDVLKARIPSDSFDAQRHFPLTLHALPLLR